MKLRLVAYIAILASCFSASVMSNSLSANKLKFCYENKDVPPHYLGDGLGVPEEKPGAAIEVMQQLDKEVLGFEIGFVRKPWKRCLSELQQGKVDSVIGRHSNERATFGVYPKNDQGKLLVDLAFSRTMSCFIYDESLPLKWDGQTLHSPKPLGAAVPRGYSLVKDLRKLGIDIYETTTIESAHELLFARKVKLSLSNCKLENRPSYILQHPIPVSDTAGYLIFSKRFYAEDPKRANYLWQKLRSIDKEAIYKKYQN